MRRPYRTKAATETLPRGNATTRIAKLYRRTLDGRSLSFSEFQRLIEAFGFVLRRTKGSHMIYYHAPTREMQVIQPHLGMAKAYQVKQFLDKIEKHRLTLQED